MTLDLINSYTQNLSECQELFKRREIEQVIPKFLSIYNLAKCLFAILNDKDSCTNILHSNNTLVVLPSKDQLLLHADAIWVFRTKVLVFADKLKPQIPSNYHAIRVQSRTTPTPSTGVSFLRPGFLNG